MQEEDEGLGTLIMLEVWPFGLTMRQVVDINKYFHNNHIPAALLFDCQEEPFDMH